MDLPATRTAARAEGSKHYFTGRPCKYGNIAERLTSAGICRCVDCKKQYAAAANQHWKRDPERRKVNCARWRELNASQAAEYGRGWRERHPDARRASHLKRSYGMTVECYDQMLAAQGGRCALCSIPAEGADRQRLVVDHCHVTHRVRGLLCDQCNKSLGIIEKYRAEIPKMLDYADRCDAQVQGLQEVIRADRGN